MYVGAPFDLRICVAVTSLYHRDRGVTISVRDGILKMIKGSMVVMKGIRRDNLYYLKGSAVTGQMETSNSSYDDCTEVWQVKVGHRGERSLQAPAKKGSLELSLIHI